MDKETKINRRPKVVTICGSSRFCDIMAVVAWLLERDEHAIAMGLHLLPYWYSQENIPDHLAEHEGVANEMNELHLRKIDLSDEIFVCDVNGYIGESTTREIEYAESLNMVRIRYLTQDKVGRQIIDILEKYSKFK